MAALILNPSTKWRLLVSFTPSSQYLRGRHPAKHSVGDYVGTQNGAGHFWRRVKRFSRAGFDTLMVGLYTNQYND